MARLYRRGRIWWAAGTDRFGEVWQKSTRQTDESAAKLVAARLEQDYALDAHRPPDEACTLEVAFTDLINFSKAARRSPETIEFQQTKARHVVRILGARFRCSAVTPAVTSRYAQKRLAEGAHPNTVSFEVRVLLQALRRAAKLRKFQPEIELRELRPEEVQGAYEPRDRWLTPKEYELLLAELDPARGGRTVRRRLKPSKERAQNEEATGLGRLDGREQWTKELARAVLFSWARSGESLRSFTRAHGIQASRLLWWRDRLGLADELATISQSVQAMLDPRELEEDRRDYVVTMCQTGVRLKELYGIMPDHVSLKRRTLFIAGTKTKQARRTLPITDAVAEVLEQRAKRFPSGPLFPTWGKVQRDLYAACLRIERRLNLPKEQPKRGAAAVQNPKGNPIPKSERVRPPNPFDPVTPNDLRRTYASWLAQAGVPMLHAMKLMGHGSTQMLERVYAQLAPEHLQEAVAMLPREVTKLARRPVEAVLDDSDE